MSDAEIHIAIVDDRAPNRSSLAEKLGAMADFHVLFTAANGLEFIAYMKESAELPHVVLMDIDMPEMDGIEAVAAGYHLFPSVKFIMLTVFDDDNKIFEAIQSGAVGYLLKDEGADSIASAIKQVVHYGGAPMSPRIARKTIQLLAGAKVNVKTKSESVLSDREMEILKGLVDGKDYKEISDELFISPHTTRTHIANIYKKLHVTNKAQVINLAMRKGWF
jgi:DNA-binding NarL/FixJ family response regulator